MSKARDSFLIAIAAPTKGCFIGAGHCVVPPQFPPGTKPIYEDKLVQGIECTCKSKQLGQALKKCFNPNTLPRLQVFICWLSFEREKWHDETKAFSTISALFVNTSFSPI